MADDHCGQKARPAHLFAQATVFVFPALLALHVSHLPTRNRSCVLVAGDPSCCQASLTTSQNFYEGVETEGAANKHIMQSL
jgi:hypothetical protein